MDRKDVKLLDRRFEDEHKAALAESGFKDRFKDGPPPIPGAQLVYSPAGVVGVAVEGARYVCQLPKNYAGPHLELAVIDRGRLIVTHPTLPPLLVDPEQGVTRAL